MDTKPDAIALTIPEVGRILGESPYAAKMLIESGAIRSFTYIEGGRRRVLRSDLDNFVAARVAGSSWPSVRENPDGWQQAKLGIPPGPEHDGAARSDRQQHRVRGRRDAEGFLIIDQPEAATEPATSDH